MVSIRSILASVTFFTAFVFAAPTAPPQVAVAKRDGQVLGEIVQYFENLGSDIRNLTTGFETLAGEVAQDIDHDRNITITQLINKFESIFQSNGTVQGFFDEINPADITAADLLQLTGAAIAVVKDLLLFVPSAASWILQVYKEARAEYQKLFWLPHKIIQFVLGLLSQLTGLVPSFGNDIAFFFNLLKGADNILYEIL